MLDGARIAVYKGRDQWVRNFVQGGEAMGFAAALTEPVMGDRLPRDAEILARAAQENFPVALRLLPASVRDDLLAVYGFARLTDELGDSYTGDRLAALERLEAELERAATGGTASHPVVARVAETIRRRDLSRQPFLDLIAANRQDQVTEDIATFDDLVGYCRLSANPVGRIVLALFGVATADRIGLADRVCTGLQLAEHWQDVAEDAAAGRIYLPREDRDRFAVTVADLSAPSAAPHVRALLRFEVARARSWLAAGSSLVATLDGGARLAVIGFTAGGLAALDAIEAAGFDVLACTPRPTRRRLAGHALDLWRTR